ncbi:energy transducer TonB [Flavobacterium sp. GT3R68]|uniref:energy transducer TonB n=1 Tax=Flavobacterium sp. GT3R68 TaxID=2594437 RepID=UPI000F869AE1|nr:energy transducer TonB [Flavobacterium sp. GT3R68]RTY93392.1 energy transducer TonB [Flavobacterium sp. GSN2]TRW92434.1 energy transducer TonB [Flavobacterium sp. GT3R68]
MSKVSIYENGWIDVVFEGRNQEYGAYQLRQQSPRTTVAALFLGLLFITTVVSIPVIINYFNKSNSSVISESLEDVKIVLANITPTQPKAPDQLALPIIKDPEKETVTTEKELKDPILIDASQEDKIADNGEKTKPTSPTTPTGDGSNTPSTATGKGPAVTVSTPTNPDGPVATLALDKLPEFPGGLNKFYTYVGNHFEKPETDIATIGVIVSFVIERDGSMTDIQVKKDPGYGIGKEAIRVLKSLKTKWEPGMIGGKPVRTSYNLPITVKME